MTTQLPLRDPQAPERGYGPIAKTKIFFTQHWQRGAPGQPTPEWVLRFAFRTWLVALLLKLIGSSWDMSWHFTWLRDDFAPPHLINTVGTVMVCALVLIHTYTGLGCDRRSLRLMQAGTAVFLIAAPLDVINHRVSGLDLTAWSPTHALLYIGTGIMILGAIDAWRKFAPPGPVRTLYSVGLWVFFAENVYFANGQQEYGILALRAWERGKPQAEPQLLEFAAAEIGRAVDREAVIHFALPIDPWVYPLWGIGVMALVFTVARVAIGARWSATTVACCYVSYRAAIWPLLVIGGFPASTVPFYLVFVGLAVDLAFRVARGRELLLAAMSGALVTVMGFCALFGQSLLRPLLLGDAATESAPPVDYWTIPIVALGVTAVFAGTAAWTHLRKSEERELAS